MSFARTTNLILTWAVPAVLVLLGSHSPVASCSLLSRSRHKTRAQAHYAFVDSAKALASSAALPGENWRSRTDLHANLMRDLVEAQHLLAFRNLSRIEHNPEPPPLLDMVVAEIKEGLDPKARETLLTIMPELIQIWLKTDPLLKRGFAYVQSGESEANLGKFARYRLGNLLKHVDVLLDRVFKSALFAALGSRHAPDLSTPFYDQMVWRRALAVVSFRYALSASCELALTQ